MKKKLALLSGLGLGYAPLALAQQTGVFNSCAGIGLGTIQGIICKLGDILNTIVPILIALGVVYFVWGVITYVISSDEEAKTAGRNRMIFGIIGLVVIVGMWGLVRVVTNTFGIGRNPENIVFPSTPY